MHKVRVVQPRYDQSRPYAGQVGEVVGHWGAETNEEGREGFLVEFEDGQVVGIADDEVEDVSGT
jgi:leucyl aminopeptidase (aminopeptidase T)